MNAGSFSRSAAPDNMSFLQVTCSREELNAPQKSNAKPVEWLDMDGNVLGVFKSGLETQKALNITQGDISQCCRGLRESVNGYRFRFFNEDIRPQNMLMGGGRRDTMEERTLRTTRASQQTNYSGPFYVKSSSAIALNPPELQARKWRKVIVKMGNLIIPKWVSDQPVSEELQQLHPKNSDIAKAKKRKSKGGEEKFVPQKHEILMPL